MSGAGAAARGGRALVTLAERPELAAALPSLLATRWPAFMLDGLPGHGVDLPALLVGAGRYQLVLVDRDGGPVCAGLSVPVGWDGTAAGLPSGWDGAVRAASALPRQGGAPGAICALSITIAPECGGAGLGAEMTLALRQAARDAGAQALIVPLRPPLKARYPLTPMGRFASWHTPDGRPLDPWLRLHLRLGGERAGIASPSMTITGTVAQWEAWTGLPMPSTGAYVIPGGLAPLLVDRRRDRGLYREANLWIVHRA